MKCKCNENFYLVEELIQPFENLDLIGAVCKHYNFIEFVRDGVSLCDIVFKEYIESGKL